MRLPIILRRSLTALLGVALAATVTLGVASVSGASSNRNFKVLPPSATPLGWSLDEMASAIANFSASGNDPDYYPDTPFQIVYRRPGNHFTVRPGTFLYVKVFFTDDSDPVVGDWPADKASAADYMFGRDQFGGHDLFVEVDGVRTSLDDAGYIGGPVETPDSPDGSEHLIQIGAFVAPLTAGQHTIVVGGVFDGDAVLDLFGGPLVGHVELTVTVE